MSNTAGLQVRFSLEPRLVNGEWRNIEYIRIISMTDKYNSPHRPIEPADKVRFAAQYEKWQKGLEEPAKGQPLKTWPGISPAEVNVLAQADVHTVEALAEAAESVVGADGPYLALRNDARRYLELSSNVSAVRNLEQQAKDQRAEIDMLREQLAELKRAPLEASPPRRGPGRPPKSEAAAD